MKDLKQQLAEIERSIKEQEALPLVQLAPAGTNVKQSILAELYRQREVLLKMIQEQGT
jgi:hypothetical protein